MSLRALMLLVVATASIARANPAHVHPFGPTVGTPVELHFAAPCAVYYSTVSSGSRGFIVTLYGTCYGQPAPADMVVRLGTPQYAGKQHVRVEFYNGTTVAETDYYVRDVESGELRLRPQIVPATGGVRMRLDGVDCPTAACSTRSIHTRDGQVTDFKRGPDGAIWFTLPAHAEGFGSVYVDGGLSRQYSNVIYYTDGFPRTLYERVLFPVLVHTRGFGGSEWVSEGVIANPNPWFVDADLPPGAVVRVGDGHPQGFVYAVSRYDADSLAFALRIRDASRADATLGTRIPVVREKDMVHGGDLTLLDVPRDSRYRVKVRIYAFDPMFDASGRIRTADGTFPFAMTRACTDCELEPYYAEFDVRTGLPGERTDITITPPRGSLAWAFATITNNETQEVTTITP